MGIRWGVETNSMVGALTLACVLRKSGRCLLVANTMLLIGQLIVITQDSVAGIIDLCTKPRRVFPRFCW